MMPLSISYEVDMVITQRDLELFNKLSSYGILSTKQAGILFFNSIALTTVLRRLRLLEENLYLRRIMGLESQEVLWAITDKAALTAGVQVPKRHWSKNMLEHDFKLLALRLALEGSGVAHSWLPEHEIRSSVFRKNGFRNAKQKLIPDGLMGIEVDKKRTSVAIELELTLKNKGKLRETVRRYQAQDGIHAVWYIAPTVGILNAVYSLWQSTVPGFNSTRLYVSLLENVMKDPLKAKLGGIKPYRAIDEIWTIKGAHPPAQRVSTLSEKIIEQRNGSTQENHSAI